MEISSWAGLLGIAMVVLVWAIFHDPDSPKDKSDE